MSEKQVPLHDGFTQAMIKKAAMNDQFTNTQMKIGQADPNLSFSEFRYERTFLNWFLWTNLYASSWVFRNGIDKKSDGAVTNIDISAESEPQKIDRVVVLYEKLKPDLKKLLKQGAIYGGAAALMLIEGNIEEAALATKLDISRIKKGAKMSLHIKDRWNGLSWQGTAGHEALGTSDFKKNEFYKFQMSGDTGGGDTGTLTAHYSNVLRCGNRTTTQYTKFQLSGWDMPEGQHMLQELMRDETTRASVASLIPKALIEIIKMPGIRSLFSGISGDLGGDNSESRAELDSRLSALTDLRNFNNMSFLDKDDEYSQFQLTALQGLGDILEKQRRNTAGALEIPEMILYGSADTKGLIFTGDGSNAPEVEIYQQTLNNRQEYILRPIVDKLLPILWKIANGEDMPEDVTYEFLPLFKESQTAKLERSSLVIANVVKLVEAGIMSPKVAAQEIKQYSKTTGFGSNVTEQVINGMSEEIISLAEQNQLNNIDNEESQNKDKDKKKEKKENKQTKQTKQNRTTFTKRSGK